MTRPLDWSIFDRRTLFRCFSDFPRIFSSFSHELSVEDIVEKSLRGQKSQSDGRQMMENKVKIFLKINITHVLSVTKWLGFG